MQLSHSSQLNQPYWSPSTLIKFSPTSKIIGILKVGAARSRAINRLFKTPLLRVHQDHQQPPVS